MTECQGCEAIRREIAAVRDLLTQRVDAAEKVADLRALATERALGLQTDDLARRLGDHASAIADLRESRDTGTGRRDVMTAVIAVVISGVMTLLGILVRSGK